MSKLVSSLTNEAAVANQSGAMEAETISKNGRSSKILTINMFQRMNIVFVALIALCLFACKNLQKSVNVDNNDKIYFGKIDENPLFSGIPAEMGFRKYISSSTVYPVKAIENAENYIIGRVFVEFIVEKDGSVSNVKIVGGADPILEFEALRVVKQSSNWKPTPMVEEALKLGKASPGWTPGKLNGEAVRMSYTLPINFSLAGVNVVSTSKKVKLSKKSILLEEINIVGFTCMCDIGLKRTFEYLICQHTTGGLAQAGV